MGLRHRLSLYRLLAVLCAIGMGLSSTLPRRRRTTRCFGSTLAFLVLAAILWYAFENKRFQGPPIGDMIKKRQAEILAAERAVGEI